MPVVTDNNKTTTPDRPGGKKLYMIDKDNNLPLLEVFLCLSTERHFIHVSRAHLESTVGIIGNFGKEKLNFRFLKALNSINYIDIAI